MHFPLQPHGLLDRRSDHGIGLQGFSWLCFSSFIPFIPFIPVCLIFIIFYFYVINHRKSKKMNEQGWKG